MDPPPAPQLAQRLMKHPATARLAEAFAGVSSAWLVGGAVRDLLLSEARGTAPPEPVDLDVVVEGDGPAAARVAAGALGGEVREHERFGTATVAAEGLSFDVVSARAERYPVPGALPEVRPGTLAEDLARRDFTVNALAIALTADERGALRCAPGGLDDLEGCLLRVMHAASFRDDPTRLLRLVRYGARLGFDAEQRTEALARDAIGAGALQTVSGPRIGAELRLLVGEPAALAALARAHALGLDGALHPSFDPRLDLAEQAGARAEASGADRGLVVLAACCTRYERSHLGGWLDRLGLSASERAAVIAAALDADTLATRLRHAHKASEIRHLLLGRPGEEIAMVAALGANGAVERWEREVRNAALAVTGDDLLAAGVPEGPAVGRGLDAAWAAALDEGARGREEQLAAALRAVR